MQPLIDLGKLTKPATVLIERISDAVGGIAKPWQIRRIAKAEADADIIRANAQIHISELERRGLERMVRDEGRKQENIESITAKAIPLLSDQAKPDEIERDWISHFFERSRITSDEEMQKLWAAILAGEANSPGRFSKRTVDLVATFGKQDAALFTKLCSYTFHLSKGPICVIFASDERPYPDYTLTFEDLTHLDSLGLIRFDMTAGFCFQDLPKTIPLEYFDSEIAVEFPDDDKWDFMRPANSDGPKRYRLNTGAAFFTRAGIELSGVCGAKASQDALDSVLKYWMDEEAYTLWSPLTSATSKKIVRSHPASDSR